MSIFFEENMSAGCLGIETIKPYLINAYEGKHKAENEVKRLVNTSKQPGVKVVETQGDHALDAKCSKFDNIFVQMTGRHISSCKSEHGSSQL